jgi:hypothetical protein
MASAKVTPGRHTVTATLRRPGRVGFDGLGVALRADSRSWAEVRATVPERLGDLGAAHLVLAVEVCGPERQVAAHLDRAAQLVGNVAAGAGCRVGFSLLAYGAHPHDWRVRDDPVAVLAWGDRKETVLGQLSMLRRQAVARHDHYVRAASIECMLDHAATLLGGQRPPDGRPVLVTIGSRHPFPAWLDRDTEIVPCPAHRDWRDLISRLKDEHSDMTFGAICGGDRDAQAWQLLGADASADLIVLDARRFAADLRLVRRAAEQVPFPLADR